MRHRRHRDRCPKLPLHEVRLHRKESDSTRALRVVPLLIAHPLHSPEDHDWIAEAKALLVQHQAVLTSSTQRNMVFPAPHAKGSLKRGQHHISKRAENCLDARDRACLRRWEHQRPLHQALLLPGREGRSSPKVLDLILRVVLLDDQGLYRKSTGMPLVAQPPGTKAIVDRSTRSVEEPHVPRPSLKVQKRHHVLDHLKAAHDVLSRAQDHLVQRHSVFQILHRLTGLPGDRHTRAPSTGAACALNMQDYASHIEHLLPIVGSVPQPLADFSSLLLIAVSPTIVAEVAH